MKKIIFILFILLVLIINIYPETNDRKQILEFAKYLKSKGEYYRAITEFMRLNNYYPDNSYYYSNLKNIAECYLRANHYKESIQVWKRVLKEKNKDWESTYNIAKIYNKINYFYESNDHINSQLKLYSKKKKDKLIKLSINNDFYLSNYNNVNNKLKKLSAESLKTKKRVKKILNHNTPLRYKSRTIGAILASIIPGGGYFYTGKYETGIAAMTLNGLLGWATYSSFRDGKDSLGGTFGVLFASFHFGSVYGTLQAVDGYNRKLKLELAKKVEFLK